MSEKEYLEICSQFVRKISHADEILKIYNYKTWDEMEKETFDNTIIYVRNENEISVFMYNIELGLTENEMIEKLKTEEIKAFFDENYNDYWLIY